jgi:hypothetical protein
VQDAFIGIEWSEFPSTISPHQTREVAFSPIECRVSLLIFLFLSISSTVFWIQFFVPLVQTFTFRDAIPFHISLIGSRKSLDAFDSTTLRITVRLKRCVSAKNNKRESAYAEQFIADASDITRSLSSSFEPKDGGQSLDWEGTISYKAGTKLGNFNLGTVEVHVSFVLPILLLVGLKAVQLGRSLFTNLAQEMVGVAIQSSPGRRSH